MRKLCKVSEGLNGFSMEKPMRQIVYFSTATSRQDAPTIAALMAVSGDFPGGEKITGLLVAGGHRYLQVIEDQRSRWKRCWSQSAAIHAMSV
jgi:hypothetical protein